MLESVLLGLRLKPIANSEDSHSSQTSLSLAKLTMKALSFAGTSDHYGSHEGETNILRPLGDAAAPMSLFTCAVNYTEWLYGIGAIWVAADPISSTLTIDELDQSSIIQATPISIQSHEGTITNMGEGSVKKTLQWKYTTNKSSTIAVNNWWSAKGSIKFTINHETKAKAGVPAVADIETTLKLGLEIMLEGAGGQSFTNGETTSTITEQTITEEVTVGPGTAVRGTATYIQYGAKDVIWRGTMRNEYADKSGKVRYSTSTALVNGFTNLVRSVLRSPVYYPVHMLQKHQHDMIRYRLNKRKPEFLRQY